MSSYVQNLSAQMNNKSSEYSTALTELRDLERKYKVRNKFMEEKKMNSELYRNNRNQYYNIILENSKIEKRNLANIKKEIIKLKATRMKTKYKQQKRATIKYTKSGRVDKRSSVVKRGIIQINSEEYN